MPGGERPRGAANPPAPSRRPALCIPRPLPRSCTSPQWPLLAAPPGPPSVAEMWQKIPGLSAVQGAVGSGGEPRARPQPRFSPWGRPGGWKGSVGGWVRAAYGFGCSTRSTKGGWRALGQAVGAEGPSCAAILLGEIGVSGAGAGESPSPPGPGHQEERNQEGKAPPDPYMWVFCPCPMCATSLCPFPNPSSLRGCVGGCGSLLLSLMPPDTAPLRGSSFHKALQRGADP